MISCSGSVASRSVLAALLCCNLARPSAGQSYYLDASLSIISPGPASILQQSAAYAEFSINNSLIEADVVVAVSNATGVMSTGCNIDDFPHNLDGSIVVISRGDCRFLLKANLALLNGAAAMVVVDNVNSANAPIMSSGAEYIPQQLLPFISVAVTRSTGRALVNAHNQARLSNDPFILRIAPIGDDVVVNGNGGNTISGQTKFASRFVFYTSGVVILAVIVLMSVRFCRRNDRFLPVYLVEDRELPDADVLLDGLHSYVYGGDKKECVSMSPDSTHDALPPQHSQRPPGTKDAVGRVHSDTVESLDALYVDDVAVASCKSEHETEDDYEAIEVEEDETCCICLAAYSTGDVITELPCTHGFHGDCIGPWLRQHRDCPLCKRDVYQMHFGREAIVLADPHAVGPTIDDAASGTARGRAASSPLAVSTSLTSLTSSASWSSASSDIHLSDARRHRDTVFGHGSDTSSDDSLMSFTPDRHSDMLGITANASERVPLEQVRLPHDNAVHGQTRRMLVLPPAGTSAAQDVTVL
eukprot:m.908574 g.908574  ORF g.908574 m.908574 type:complete len:529 (-) comp23714_c0_seq8:2691-4277(-)